MSLRIRILLVLSLVVASFVGIDNVLQRFVVARTFEALELTQARRDAARVRAALQDEIDELAEKARERAIWAPTRRFVEEPFDEYRTSNLGPSALDDQQLDLWFLCNAEGDVLFGRIADPETRETIKLREFPSGALSRRHPLIAVHELGRPGAGVMHTEHGALLVSSHPVRRDGASDEAEPTGWVVMGRFLSERLVARLSEQVHVPFVAWPLEGGTLPGPERDVIDRVTGSAVPVPSVASDTLLHVYASFPDLRGRPAVLLRADVGREITQRGWETVSWALLSTVGSALLLLFVLLQVLQRSVVKPLVRLTRHALEIGRTEDVTTRLNMVRDDEIGQLASEFDSMLGKLEHSRRQLVETARAAGMSEIATGVIHNVGNALNSVNVAASVAAAEAKGLETQDLERLVEVLEQHEPDLGRFISEDPRGKHFLPLLASLSKELVRRKHGVIEELERLSAGLEGIIELVAAQQRWTGAKGVVEKTSLAGVIDDALSMCERSGTVLEEVEIVRQYEELPPFAVDRHRLLEVLVQLLRNARQALDEGGGDRRLLLRLERGPAGTPLVSVTDGGVGIAAENLQRIFNHGFTTRAGSSGFGLHVAANVAREMGAVLSAASDGPGRGATFTIALDAAPGAGESVAEPAGLARERSGGDRHRDGVGRVQAGHADQHR